MTSVLWEVMTAWIVLSVTILLKASLVPVHLDTVEMAEQVELDAQVILDNYVTVVST